MRYEQPLGVRCALPLWAIEHPTVEPSHDSLPARGRGRIFRFPDGLFLLTDRLDLDHPSALKELSLAIDQMGCRIGVDHYVWLRAC